jgi:hypothetical protein
MRQFEVNGKTFNLKNSWEDLKFNDWVKFQKLEQEKELLGLEDEFIIRALLLLTDCEENDILNLHLDLLNQLVKDFDFINLPVPKIENRYLILGGEKWAFKKDFEKLTMGEYISIKTFQENVKDESKSTYLVLSVLLRKVLSEDGELVLDSFRPDDCKKIASLLENEAMMCDLYHYLSFFFAGKNKSTLIDTEAFLVVQGLKAQGLENTN